MSIESKDILQIDVIIITGLLLLISFSSVIPEMAKIGTLGVTPNPKTYASFAILAFSASAAIEVFKIIIPHTKPEKPFRLRFIYYSSLWFMLAGFIVMIIFAFLLYYGIRITSGT